MISEIGRRLFVPDAAVSAVVVAVLAGPADDAPAPRWDPRPGSRPRGAIARKDPQATASNP